MPKFDLLERNWIPVEFLTGQVREVSLTDVFARAAEIRSLIGTPLEVAVLYRLLFAITHDALQITNQKQWTTQWNELGTVPAKIGTYLQTHRDAFDLYSETKPFAQHPALPFGSKSTAVIVFDRAQGNNAIFLDAAIEASATPISSALAARALLSNMAFGGSHPDKSSPLAGPKDSTMYAGPLCARLVGVLEGESLIKTLLLNTIATPNTSIGRPFWRRELPAGPKTTTSEGIADLYTRLTRFIRLTPSEDGELCLGVALHMGERLAEEEPPSDPMIPLRLASDKKLKVLRLESGKALWRSAHVLLSSEESTETRPIRALSQLAASIDFAESEPVGLRILGMCGNAQGPTTEFWRDETLPFNVTLLEDSPLKAELDLMIKKAEEGADLLRKRLYGFCLAYMRASQPNPDPKDVAKLMDEIAPGRYDYWSRLSIAGERLGLERPSRSDWEADVKRAGQSAFERAVDQLPMTGVRLRAQFSRSDKSKKDKHAI